MRSRHVDGRRLHVRRGRARGSRRSPAGARRRSRPRCWPERDPLPALAGRAVTGGRLNARAGRSGSPPTTPAPAPAPAAARAPAAPAAPAPAAARQPAALRGKPVLCRRRGCRQPRRAARRSRCHRAPPSRPARAPALRRRPLPLAPRRHAAGVPAGPGTQRLTVGPKLLGMRLAAGHLARDASPAPANAVAAHLPRPGALSRRRTGKLTAWPHRWTRSP